MNRASSCRTLWSYALIRIGRLRTHFMAILHGTVIRRHAREEF